MTPLGQARLTFSRKLADVGFGGIDDEKFCALLNIALGRERECRVKPTIEQYEQATVAVGKWMRECRPPAELFRMGLEQAQEAFLATWAREHPGGEIAPLGNMNEMLGLEPDGSVLRRRALRGNE